MLLVLCATLLRKNMKRREDYYFVKIGKTDKNICDFVSATPFILLKMRYITNTANKPSQGMGDLKWTITSICV